MMLYAVTKQDDIETATLFYSYDEYHTATFTPDIETTCLIELDRLKGKTYKERKADLQSKAITFSNNAAPGLYMSDMVEISNYFERYGERYGLLTEFRDESII